MRKRASLYYEVKAAEQHFSVAKFKTEKHGLRWAPYCCLGCSCPGVPLPGPALPRDVLPSVSPLSQPLWACCSPGSSGSSSSEFFSPLLRKSGPGAWGQRWPRLEAAARNQTSPRPTGGIWLKTSLPFRSPYRPTPASAKTTKKKGEKADFERGPVPGLEDATPRSRLPGPAFQRPRPRAGWGGAPPSAVGGRSPALARRELRGARPRPPAQRPPRENSKAAAGPGPGLASAGREWASAGSQGRPVAFLRGTGGWCLFRQWGVRMDGLLPWAALPRGAGASPASQSVRSPSPFPSRAGSSALLEP